MSEIRSVVHALTVVDQVMATGGVRVREVAEDLGIAPSSAHRLLSTLASREYVVQDPHSRIYRPGVKLLGLTGGTVGTREIRHAAHRPMEALAAATGESVSLSVLIRSEVEFVDGIESGHILRASPRIGARLPAHSTAGGRVLLADLALDDVSGMFGGGLKKLTDRTVDTVPELTGMLARIRQAGYAVSRGESTEGISAVAVAIRPAGGRAAAGLAVVAPTERLPDTGLSVIIDHLLRAAGDTAAALPHTAGRSAGPGSEERID
ncbi:IclR family transcriptional regulator [Citricoccus nitrophenolicus]|uniref:IclR family transcriptional regulator n=1 Tax=Citricoccus nitrophenolicus TaxID=863575 RepID=A0ABV0IKN6_9MICC